MQNVTSQYPAQTFLAPASSQITAQINAQNANNIPSLPFPRTFTRTSFAGVAPDGSLAVMYQIDALLNPNVTYAFQLLKDAQRATQEAAAQNGNEFYIELSPLQPLYYSILTWASNI